MTLFGNPPPRWRWAIWLAYVLAWTAALLMPSPDRFVRAVISLISGSPAATHDAAQPLFWIAKAAHVLAYTVLAILSGWLRFPWRLRWLLLLFISAHAFGTEFLQGFVPSRHASLRDVGLDHLGAVLGIALSWKWWLSRP